MANTLGDLKTRIITETNRDDLSSGGALETQLALCLTRAIEHYSDELFWFNRTSASASTTAAVAYVARPAALRLVETVVYSGCPLKKFSAEDIEYTTSTGQPTRWAPNGANVQLSPIPDAVYSLTFYGIAQTAIPASDGLSNIWTTEAQDLIAARTRFLLFRDVFRDTEGTQLAAQAEGEAVSKLRRETRRRNVTPLRSNGDEPWSACSTFNINSGY